MVHRFRFPTLLALAVALIALGIVSSGSAVDAAVPSGKPTTFSMLGLASVQGEAVIVDVVVAVQPGQNAVEVARAALAAQGARPFDSARLGSEGFTLTGLLWDSLPVVQYYNASNEPSSLSGSGQTALTNTHATWDGVATSLFDIDSGGLTTRCPSLVKECPGRQSFDGFNDVGWVRLDRRTLGVTWYGTTTDEADMALNTRFSWNDGCANVSGSYDVQTVFLHENGHVVGLGHSNDANTIMFPSYQGATCTLDQDDQEGATYLYDNNVTGTVSGTVTDGTGGIEGATVVLQDTGLQAITASDGAYTISGIPDPVTYTVTASADGFETSTISRLTVVGATGADFALTPTGGGDDGGGGGGPPFCGSNPNHPACQ